MEADKTVTTELEVSMITTGFQVQYEGSIDWIVTDVVSAEQAQI